MIEVSNDKEDICMNIVVLDGYAENPGDLSWEELEKLGKLTVYDRTSLTDEEEIIHRIGDAEVVSYTHLHLEFTFGKYHLPEFQLPPRR